MAFRKRTNAYWDKRAEEQLTYVEQEALPHIKDIDRAYRDARKYTLDEVKKLYLAYYAKEGWDTDALRAIAPRGDIRRFQEAVRAAGLIDELPTGYGFRLNRLELLEANLWLEAGRAAKTHTQIQTAAHLQTVDTAYDYALYNLAKGTGVAPAFSQINTRSVERILNSKFYGKNYSERVWNNRSKLVKGLKRELATSVASGQSYSKTARAIRNRYDVTRYEAQRLVQTETNHFNTMGSIESYKAIDLEEFVFVATLDGRTSKICQEHDGKRYPLTSTGNKPPLHPSCRSCVRAYLGKEYEPDERIMRDPKTGKNRYISNISYDQWKELQL